MSRGGTRYGGTNSNFMQGGKSNNAEEQICGNKRDVPITSSEFFTALCPHSMRKASRTKQINEVKLDSSNWVIVAFFFKTCSVDKYLQNLVFRNSFFLILPALLISVSYLFISQMNERLSSLRPYHSVTSWGVANTPKIQSAVGCYNSSIVSCLGNAVAADFLLQSSTSSSSRGGGGGESPTSRGELYWSQASLRRVHVVLSRRARFLLVVCILVHTCFYLQNNYLNRYYKIIVFWKEKMFKVSHSNLQSCVCFITCIRFWKKLEGWVYNT